MIDNKIESLEEPFRTKVRVFLTMVKIKYPNVAPFETRRSLARQKRLKVMGKSWTLNSKHIVGKAVDWVFLNKRLDPTRTGDYKFLHYIGFMCGMTPIYSKGKLIESCHLEDDGRTIKQVMNGNSTRYNACGILAEENLLASVNKEFRKY